MTSWKKPINGSWTNARRWTGNQVPSPADDVVLGGTGAYTVTSTGDPAAANSITLTDADAALVIRNTAGIFSQHHVVLNVTNGITGAGSDAAPITVKGYYAILGFQGTQTIDDVTIDLGNNAQMVCANIPFGLMEPGVVTLGTDTVVNSFGHGGDLNGYFFVNDGTINVTAPENTFAIGVQNFVNNGTINVGTGDRLTLWLSSADSANDGVINVSSGGVLELQLGGFGSSTIYNQSGTINNTGGRIIVDGDYNGPADFSVLNGLGDWVFGGNISNGTVKNLNKELVRNVELTDIVFDGTLHLGQDATLNLYGGLTMAGADGSGTGIVNAKQSSQIDVQGTQTIAGAIINLDEGVTLVNQPLNGVSSTLTLASGVVVHQLGETVAILSGTQAGNSIINNGVIDA